MGKKTNLQQWYQQKWSVFTGFISYQSVYMLHSVSYKENSKTWFLGKETSGAFSQNSYHLQVDIH